MIRTDDFNITTYYHTYNNNVYVVDIVTTPATYEAWIYTHSAGIKMLMWGADKEQHESKQDFIDLVTVNIPDYIPLLEEALQ
jgi:hypothetical protein